MKAAFGWDVPLDPVVVARQVRAIIALPCVSIDRSASFRGVSSRIALKDLDLSL